MMKLDFIKTFVAMGISVIPLHHRSKEPMLASWQPYQSILSSDTEIAQWFPTDWCNYGVVAGWHDLMFLDFDDMEMFSIWLDWFLLDKYGTTYPMPFIVKTARGAHVYVSCPSSGANERRLGCDVKRHGYVVGPGSTHPSGTQYEAITELKLVQVFSLSTILPDELFPLVTPAPGACAPDFSFQQSHTEYQSDPFVSASTMTDVDLITKVKRAVRIENLFSNVRKTSVDGRWLAALCPFHDDHNPSLWIDVAKQLCGCNVCGMKPMDAINLYARMHNVSNSEAVSQLAKEIGIWR